MTNYEITLNNALSEAATKLRNQAERIKYLEGYVAGLESRIGSSAPPAPFLHPNFPSGLGPRHLTSAVAVQPIPPGTPVKLGDPPVSPASTYALGNPQ